MNTISPRNVTSTQKIRILWVEDNSDDVDLGLAALRAGGFDPICETVHSQRSFARRLRTGRFDVILADFQLPSWSGVQALDFLRKTDAETPFILVTGALGEATAIRCMKRGITDYVLKDGLARLPISVRLALVNKELRAKSSQTATALQKAEAESREQLRRLAAHIESVREDERKRVSLEVHDVLGQALTGLKLDLAWVISRLGNGDDSVLRRAKAMSRLIDSTVQTVRKITTDLRPGILDQLGLFAAIEWQAQQFEAKTGVRCRCSIRCPERKFDGASSTALFRIFQEILANVTTRAKATEVEVIVRYLNDSLVLEVRDNGRRINARRTSHVSSLGILGIRERAYMLGGDVAIGGRTNKGTTVLVRLPLENFLRN